MTTSPPAETFPRMLVAHAERDARTFIRRRFTSVGYEVVEAGDAEATLAAVDGPAFDLAIVDLQIAGPELLRRIRQLRSAAELPLLALAEHAAAEDVVEALACGADDCLLRPLSMDVAQSRARMLARRLPPTCDTHTGELRARLETLEDSALRTEAAAAGVEALGHDLRAPINGLLGAAQVLTAVCRTPQLQRSIDRIETAAAALDLVLVRALGRADRRSREPKTKLRVLLADDDRASRARARELLDAATVEVELIEATAGPEASLALDTMFFDLFVVNVAAPQAIAAIRALREAELQSNTRRTPILALAGANQQPGDSLDAGADLFLRQPATPERLLSALADALTRGSDEVRAVA